jgi:hypothetical protein
VILFLSQFFFFFFFFGDGVIFFFLTIIFFWLLFAVYRSDCQDSSTTGVLADRLYGQLHRSLETRDSGGAQRFNNAGWGVRARCHAGSPTHRSCCCVMRWPVSRGGRLT